MSLADMQSLLKRLPKCEHHIHIEGSLEPDLLFTLAARNNVTLPDSDEYATPDSLRARYISQFSSLDDFLKYYYFAMSVLQTAEDFAELAWAYFQRAHADGVVHAEISFDPQAHISRGVAFSAILAGLTEARARAEKELGMSTNLICCFLRHLPVAEAEALFATEEVQTAIKGGLISAIGLDSSEIGFPPEPFSDLYSSAQQLGLNLTAHAGEEGPASNVDTVVFQMSCERVDHGLRVIDDPDVVERIAERGSLLTLCPLSNLKLQCVRDTKDLPIRHFLKKGVKFSINSDDPAYFGGYILANYMAVQEAFDLSTEDWKKICLDSIMGSFCGHERKAELVQLLSEI